jgi:hypothetical protein
MDTIVKNEVANVEVLTNSFQLYFKKILVGRKKFVCGFNKVNGEWRTGTFERVLKNKNSNTAEWVKHTYATVFDKDKQDYRKLNFNGIKYLEVPSDKTKYIVDVTKDKNGSRIVDLKPVGYAN